MKLTYRLVMAFSLTLILGLVVFGGSRSEAFYRAGAAGCGPRGCAARPADGEKLSEAERRRVSRANSVEALRRGDMQTYFAQSIMANQPGTDALEYARQWPGAQTPFMPRSTTDWVRSMQPAAQAPTLPAIGSDGNPAAPRYVPAPMAQPSNSGVLRSLNPTIGPDGNPILPSYAPVTRRWAPTSLPTTSRSPWDHDPEI